mgnify:CR=1 FL=1
MSPELFHHSITSSLKRPKHENNIQNRKKQVHQTTVSVKGNGEKLFYRDVKIVLNFNYFITSNLDEEESNCNILFKLRRPILAEVQSKLARHINRQGVVSL